jgi:hypothetical protein
MKKFLFLLIIHSYIQLNATDDYAFHFRNEVYDEYIKSVTLETNNLPTNFPVITLNSGQYVMLKFDDLLNEERTLFYHIIHCDKNWKPSKVSEIESISGFNNERLRNYEYSINTRVPYIHYWQQFPNKDTEFKLSGNYLIVIYEDNMDYPILTRRFIVKENRVNIDITNVYSTDVENIRYKQDLQVIVNYGKFAIRNPLEDVTLMVMKNEEWNSIKESKPSFVVGSTLKFTKPGTFSWWGLNEFRDFDTRTLMRVGRGVQYIERNSDNTKVIIKTDLPRTNKVHLTSFDFNGKYFVNNFEGMRDTRIIDVLDNFAKVVNANETQRQSLRDSLVSSLNIRNNLLDGTYQAEERNIRSDYTDVTFILDDANDQSEGDIYILGGMNSYQPSEEFKLKYDAKNDIYTTEVRLKQGYYNYMYGVVNEKNEVTYKNLEGSWSETENDFQALVYYRGIGDLYDRVIGYQQFNSNTTGLYLR